MEKDSVSLAYSAIDNNVSENATRPSNASAPYSTLLMNVGGGTETLIGPLSSPAESIFFLKQKLSNQSTQ